MLHNEITSEREREIFKVNYAVVVVVAFYCQTHTQFVYWAKVWGWKETLLLFDNRRGHTERMKAYSRQKIIHLWYFYHHCHRLYFIVMEVGEIEILTHLRHARNHKFSSPLELYLMNFILIINNDALHLDLVRKINLNAIA